MGRKVGRKRSDRRWIGADGTQYDSKFEEEVHVYLQRAIGPLGSVRRCGKGDSFSYNEPKAGSVSCLDCGGTRCAQRRIYTSDFLVDTGTHVYWLETKGKFLASKRALFRAFRKDQPDIMVRVVLQANNKVGVGKMTDYFAKFLKTTPVVVWNSRNPSLPREWIL